MLFEGIVYLLQMEIFIYAVIYIYIYILYIPSYGLLFLELVVFTCICLFCPISDSVKLKIYCYIYFNEGISQ